jgi:hypothetical protein
LFLEAIIALAWLIGGTNPLLRSRFTASPINFQIPFYCFSKKNIVAKSKEISPTFTLEFLYFFNGNAIIKKVFKLPLCHKKAAFPYLKYA